MSNKTYYPIYVTTLNRYEHLRRLIESLQRNTHAEKTELVIGLDYPPSDKYKDGWKRIKAYLPTVTGFKKVTVLEANHNLGAKENTRVCRQYIKDSGYEAFIASEDDNEFSPCFLDYMNKLLEFYRDNEKIQFLCGYTPFEYNEGHSVFCSIQMSAWGWASWFHKYKKVAPYLQPDFQRKILHDTPSVWKIFKRKPNITNGLVGNVFRGHCYGDVTYEAYNILNGTFSVFPTLSLCRNWGNDGSGLHCKDNSTRFVEQKISDEKVFDFIPCEICEEKKVRKSLEISMGNTSIKNAGYVASYLFYRLLGVNLVKQLQYIGLIYKG